jgi:hypothetical protein
MRTDRANILRLLVILVSFAVVVTPRLSAQGNTSPPKHPKEREFNRRFIEHLPREQRDVYSSKCQNDDEPECPGKMLISFAETMCRFFAEGRYKTRNEALESMGGFFGKESEAFVDTAIEVICPQHRDR